MKKRWSIDKDKVIFYIIVILIAVASILWIIHKIKIKEWENQVEEPNTAEDYASDEESEFVEDSLDKYIYVGRIDAWPKRIYCFECTADGDNHCYETEELLPIHMEIGDLVKITGEKAWWGGGCESGGFEIKSIDSIKFVNEEVYIASIPEITRINKDYIRQRTTRKVVDPYGINSGSVVTGVPYDYIYCYYEDTGEIIAYFKNFVSIDENEVSEIDKGDMADVNEYYYVKKDGKVYKYEHSICYRKDGKDGNGYWYYTNIDIPEEEMDKVLKQQRNEDIFFEYIIEP